MRVNQLEDRLEELSRTNPILPSLMEMWKTARDQLNNSNAETNLLLRQFDANAEADRAGSGAGMRVNFAGSANAYPMVRCRATAPWRSS
jgi:hypothetical protein